MSTAGLGEARQGRARRGGARQGKAITTWQQRLSSQLKPVDVRCSMVFEDGQVKRVYKEFSPAEFATIELIMLTDLQYGHKRFKNERFEEYRDWILSVPNRFVFLGGDLIDAATKLSKASPFDNKGHPQGQAAEVVKLLAPLQPRVLGYVGGNHERRTEATWGEAGWSIARELAVPYSAGVQLIDIAFGEHKPFKASIWHGSGSARTKGAKAQMVHRFMQQADSQVYLCGHLHDALVLFDWRQRRYRDGIHLQKIAGVMSTSFLDYWNTYAEVAGLSPSDTLMARIILDPKGGWEVTLK